MSERSWDVAWQEALYGPDGFYRQPAGPAAHFATSAQGLPGVGRILARAVATLCRQYALSSIVEIGAGRGELLATLHEVDPALSLHGIDVVRRPPGLPGAVAWSTSPGGAALPDDLGALDGVLVLAHEWLDVVPLTVGEVDEDGSLRVVHVTETGQEHLGAPLGEADLQWCQRFWPAGEPGDRVEVGATRDRAWADLCARVRQGVVVGVDYGHERTDRPAFGTLTGYREGAQVQPVPDGSCDITAHVAVDSLDTSWRTRQRALLTELGVVARPAQHEMSRTDPGRYLAALAERSAGLSATAAQGLGDFWWFVREIGVRRQPSTSTS
ncbi:SAM-dependent methyltransferase [Luteipulveratus flavus]|uniref:SAM-dependent methyltransferase n=1 Tax=Luteipulveratus flavus TaxID=3031728 RepID=A0ABT6C7M5_9MICO|nr:SAM-dependent methyltransferase [Luteipulveratus sp. YIM 133296]MDF8264711.1 SAM-dependent methyltransferase [Luteipulveratus sp. YIM 133296]